MASQPTNLQASQLASQQASCLARQRASWPADSVDGEGGGGGGGGGGRGSGGGGDGGVASPTWMKIHIFWNTHKYYTYNMSQQHHNQLKAMSFNYS